MQTELSFLLDLLLNHPLQKGTKRAITARITEVEQSLPWSTQVSLSSPVSPPVITTPSIALQAPSTQAILLANPDLIPKATQPEIIAKTPEAIKALESRQAAINAAITGTVEKGQTRPRRF